MGARFRKVARGPGGLPARPGFHFATEGAWHPMTSDVDIAARKPLRERLGRVARGRFAPGLGGFWRWWGRALASWLPARVRALLELDGRRLLLREDGAGLHVALERNGQARELVRLPWQDATGEDPLHGLLPPALAALPRWLVLPASAALRRPMVVPAAAADRLHDVLGFEIDRQTPFTAGEVRHDARVTGRADGQLEVELVVVPRPVYDEAIRRVGGSDAGLAGVDLDDAGGEPLGVNLLPAASRRRRADPWQRWNLALAVLAAVAVASAMWMVLDNRRDAADAFEQASLQRIAQAREASGQRRQVADHIEGMQHLARLRAARPTMVEVLDELSRRLPDNSFLEKLSVENDRLLLIGQSTEASALVRELGESPLWREPALAGALQPDPRSRRDRFTLTAELVLAASAAAPGEPGGADAQRNP